MRAVRLEAEMIPEIMKGLRAGDGLLAADPTKQFEKNLQGSLESWALLFHNRPAVIWGIYQESFLDDSAGVWMATTLEVEKHPMMFLRESRVVIRGLLSRYRVLWGLVDAYYLRSIRWLQWVGFTIHPPENWNGMLVSRFEMRRA